MDIKRNPQIGATDYLLRLDDGTAISFDTEQEAQLAMAAIEASEKPIEAELAARITGEILPQLRALFASMTAMQVDWHDNDMAQKIEQAVLSQSDVFGFSPSTWALWGKTFNALREWLETDNVDLGGLKPRTVLQRRYIAEVQ